jgi:Uri superfamily endonuclease|tara:strand:- start:919 stop:1386 length:468 start_codon:yes stop_codon:yes gene_type:complete
MHYLDKLIATCEVAKKTSSIRELIISYVRELENLDGIKKAIYIIEETSTNKETLFNDFVTYKKLKLRACAKANSPSSILYVGSSTTGVKKRIEQHLGYGPEKTYALHLKHWLKDLVNIRISVKEFDAPSEVIQLIEDSLSYDLRPAFGKRGGNNK